MLAPRARPDADHSRLRDRWVATSTDRSQAMKLLEALLPGLRVCSPRARGLLRTDRQCHLMDTGGHTFQAPWKADDSPAQAFATIMIGSADSQRRQRHLSANASAGLLACPSRRCASRRPRSRPDPPGEVEQVLHRHRGEVLDPTVGKLPEPHHAHCNHVHDHAFPLSRRRWPRVETSHGATPHHSHLSPPHGRSQRGLRGGMRCRTLEYLAPGAGAIASASRPGDAIA